MAQTQVPPKNRRIRARYIVLLAAVLVIAAALLWFFSAHGQAHYLLIGKDNWGPVGEGRSDVMMLCTLDMDGRRVSITSLARDLKIELPGKNKREDKLNTVTHYQDEAALVSVWRSSWACRSRATFRSTFPAWWRSSTRWAGSR